MLKNLNDYISFGVLIFLTIYALRLLIASFFNFRTSKSFAERIELLRDYQNNTED